MMAKDRHDDPEKKSSVAVPKPKTADAPKVAYPEIATAGEYMTHPAAPSTLLGHH